MPKKVGTHEGKISIRPKVLQCRIIRHWCPIPHMWYPHGQKKLAIKNKLSADGWRVVAQRRRQVTGSRGEARPAIEASPCGRRKRKELGEQLGPTRTRPLADCRTPTAADVSKDDRSVLESIVGGNRACEFRSLGTTTPKLLWLTRDEERKLGNT
jgi:hypothetical protein